MTSPIIANHSSMGKRPTKRKLLIESISCLRHRTLSSKQASRHWTKLLGKPGHLDKTRRLIVPTKWPLRSKKALIPFRYRRSRKAGAQLSNSGSDDTRQPPGWRFLSHSHGLICGMPAQMYEASAARYLLAVTIGSSSDGFGIGAMAHTIPRNGRR